MAYGLMKYEFTRNLGDEIQSIAARSFLPQVDVYVDRERMSDFHHQEPAKTILNGWFMHSPEHWPPSPDIIPLLISFNINSGDSRVTERFLAGSGGAFLRHYGRPIGARDTSTLALLQAENIPAYFSGCLTLTLKKDLRIQREPYVCAVDVSEALLDFLRRQTGLPVYALSHEAPGTMNSSEKFAMAETLLEIYQGAQYVVTGRLHAAMPCLAYETPVLLVDYATDSYRFSGLEPWVRHGPESSVLKNQIDFDFCSPTPNSDSYRPYQKKLIEQCIDFVGSDSYHHSTHPPSSSKRKAMLMDMLCKAQTPKGMDHSGLLNFWSRLTHG